MIDIRSAILLAVTLSLLLQHSQERIPLNAFNRDRFSTELVRIIGNHPVIYQAQLESVIYLAASAIAKNHVLPCRVFEQLYTTKISNPQSTGTLDLAMDYLYINIQGQIVSKGLVIELKLNRQSSYDAYEQARDYSLRRLNIQNDDVVYIGIKCNSNQNINPWVTFGHLQQCFAQWDQQDLVQYYYIFADLDQIFNFQTITRRAFNNQLVVPQLTVSQLNSDITSDHTLMMNKKQFLSKGQNQNCKKKFNQKYKKRAKKNRSWKRHFNLHQNKKKTGQKLHKI